MSAIFSKDNSKRNGKMRGELMITIGQCCTGDKYSHNYLDCDECTVDKTLRCSIQDCPCNGQGYLFPVHGSTTCFSHQIAGQMNSVRVYTNRPKRTIDAVSRSIKKTSCLSANPQSKSREVRKRMLKEKSTAVSRKSKKLKRNSNYDGIAKPSNLSMPEETIAASLPLKESISASQSSLPSCSNMHSDDINLDSISSIPLFPTPTSSSMSSKNHLDDFCIDDTLMDLEEALGVGASIFNHFDSVKSVI